MFGDDCLISEKAVVQTSRIGKEVSIEEFAVIRSDVIIGENVSIHPYVVIEDGVVIGDNVEIFPGSYIGKIPKGAGALARTPKFKKTIVIGNQCSIGPNAIIYYDVQIGDNTLIGDGASIREECKIGAKCVIGRYVTINYECVIGNCTKIMDHTWLGGKIVIEDDVFISGCVGMANDNNMGKNGYKDKEIQGPYVKTGTAIGLGAAILPNVTIGSNTIIGAGTLVTKDIPDGSTVMGIPGRLRN